MADDDVTRRFMQQDADARAIEAGTDPLDVIEQPKLPAFRHFIGKRSRNLIEEAQTSRHGLCDSNPTHGPAVGILVLDMAEPMPLCADCLRWRVDQALRNHEHFAVMVS